MYRKYLYIIVAAGLLLCASCDKEIEFTGEDTAPYPVMMGNATADSNQVTVWLSWSRFFLDTSETYPTADGAKVTLLCNGTPYTATALNNGFYRFAVAPQPGDSITVTANIPGYECGMVVARTRVPQRPSAEILSITDDTTTDKYGYMWRRFFFRIRIDDPKGENYYRLRIGDRTLYQIRHDIDSFSQYSYPLSCDDPVIMGANNNLEENGIDIDMTRPTYDEITFSDENFDGRSYTITIQMKQNNNLTSDTYGISTPGEFQLTITSISPELYRYEKSRDKAIDNASNYFSEPVQVICNVENGIGVLGSSCATTSRKMIAKE